MKQRLGIYSSEIQKAMMWERWKNANPSSKLPSCSTEITHRYSEFWPRQAAHLLHHPVIAMGGEPGRTGRDIALTGCWSLDPLHCRITQTGNIDDQPEDQA
jgi:hypothetical protein